MSGRWKTWESLPLVGAAVACGACCAVPLLAAVGLGSGAALRLAEVAEPVGLGLLAVGAALAVGRFAWRRWSPAATCGSASCAIDGACGCAPASER